MQISKTKIYMVQPALQHECVYVRVQTVRSYIPDSLPCIHSQILLVVAHEQTHIFSGRYFIPENSWFS